MKFLCLGFILTMFMAEGLVFGQQTEQKYLKEVNYLLYLPENYHHDTITKWPVIIFLHGAGERGDDLEIIKTHGPPKLINAGQKMPFIVVSPQVVRFEQWYPDLIMLMLKDIKKNCRVDDDRIYLTGLSMGGLGTWEIVLRYPDLFAAVAPVCGVGDPSEAWKLRHTPVWIFHGEKDTNVPVINSKTMYQALLHYDNVKLTIYPEAGHDSYTETYHNPDLYTWFLSHKRYIPEEGAMPANPERYTGTYTTESDPESIFFDTADVYLKQGKLFIRMKSNGNREQPIFPTVKDYFFFDQSNTAEIKFNIGENGESDSFNYYISSFVYKIKLDFRRKK